jgi:predicted short-subunit dehydrogenase-like oxidoreductase (DUF2520 family)
MIISIIGSGNTATVLGRILKKNDHVVNEIIGRNKTAVHELAKELNANACMDMQQINANSELYIIAVRDDAVAEVAAQLNMDNKIVAHTCGSISIEVLAGTSTNFGVFYPLQTLRKELHYSPTIPFLVDGNNDDTKQALYNIAASLSTHAVMVNDETRLQYHLSAIFVSNFSNHLFALAKQYCDMNNIHFGLLLPLLEETVNRLQFFEPAAMQTGPAVRGDKTTIQKHLQLLQSFPQLKHIYEVMSESIIANISANRQ